MKTRLIALALGGIVLLAAAGCYRPAPTAPDAATVANPPGGATPPLADTVLADGSAQVAAITRAVADGFQNAQPADAAGSVAVEVNAAGPSAGFARLCGDEIDLTHAARAMAAGEAEACAANGVGWLEVVIGYDVLAVIANPSDTFLSCLTLDELRAVWGSRARQTGRRCGRGSRSAPSCPSPPIWNRRRCASSPRRLASRFAATWRPAATTRRSWWRRRPARLASSITGASLWRRPARRRRSS
ncbi:MAG: substrate-binding domain-containing protein [Anaerolineae bacterium]|nr:substrate-binding domain-containing protein [Anaerolineae bacterium]